ncbi:MAG: hypothetical protein SGJ24_09855 [Chloroflexota bacterium]|nr:hypothetical protein [Chloroflexota bacterium]
MSQRRIVVLALQALFLFVLSLGVLLFAGLRTVTFYNCTAWLTCGEQILPSLSDQYGIFEWLHHWSIITIGLLLPLVLLLAVIVFRRSDEMVMAGIRNLAMLFLIQAGAAVVTSVTSVLWQGPALHFMTAALLLVITVGIVGWALFSPNQDFSAPVLQSALVVISVIPVVPYISRFVT